MKTFYLTTLISSMLAIAAFAAPASAAPKRQPQHVIAIQVEKPPKDVPLSKHVQVGEREEQQEQKHVKVKKKKPVKVSKREKVGSRKNRPVCAECQRPVAIKKRPYCHGRVPVGRYVPRHSHGIVVYPYAPPPVPVVVEPPCRHCHSHADFSFSWNFFR